jgi:hypothetical protein
MNCIAFVSPGVLGSFPLDTDPAGHAVCATALFAAGIGFKIPIAIEFFKSGEWLLFAFRLFLITCEAGSVLITGHSDRFVSPRWGNGFISDSECSFEHPCGEISRPLRFVSALSAVPLQEHRKDEFKGFSINDRERNRKQGMEEPTQERRPGSVSGR